VNQAAQAADPTNEINTMKQQSTTLRSMRFGAALALILGAGISQLTAEIQPAALELAKSVEAKVGVAKTIQLAARHKLDPALGVGSKLENGEIHFTVERPNRFHAIQSAERETREISYDGTTFVMMYPELKHHAIEEVAAASVSEIADKLDERFGFRPPVAELLSQDFSAQIFRDVTSAKLMEREDIEGKSCDRLHFVQPGMTGDLWVGVESGLPVRYLLTFTEIEGSPTWEINLTEWKLDAPVDVALFAKRPAEDSIKVEMHKSE
jgi:hypothetical protein